MLGEGVRWDARRDELLGVDIVAGRVYRDRVDEHGDLVRIRSYDVPGTVGAIAPIEGDGGWLLACRPRVRPPGPGRLVAAARPGRSSRDTDERRRLRSAGPLLGRHRGR